jgi:ribosome-associated translation inhibitor RaiA
MQPLTHDLWAKHFVEIRPRIREEWPDVDQSELEIVRDDWDHLVALIQRTEGLSADLVQQRLRTLDIEDLNIGTGGTGDDDADDDRASLALLALGSGFEESERDRIIERLSKLNRRLKRFPADATSLELQVKERNNSGQTITFIAQLPGFAPLVATSTESDIRAALMDVREDMWRQIDDAVSRRTEGAR